MNDEEINEVSLLQLQQSIDLPLIQVWLALLLGDHPLEQRGAFYGAQAMRVLKR